ncbi:MAG: type II toxin-antitoxin system antitoxin, RelB/DinJ family [Eubacteriaceae bacterium]|nr:type II toxin-antitoxin system antitoxin, RelB/DinJ family [Eubacteriaceae bacterium]
MAQAAFEEFCLDVGLRAPVAFSLFIKAVLREQRIPFEIAASEDSFYSEENQAIIKRRISQAEAGANLVQQANKR